MDVFISKFMVNFQLKSIPTYEQIEEIINTANSDFREHMRKNKTFNFTCDEPPYIETLAGRIIFVCPVMSWQQSNYACDFTRRVMNYLHKEYKETFKRLDCLMIDYKHIRFALDIQINEHELEEFNEIITSKPVEIGWNWLSHEDCIDVSKELIYKKFKDSLIEYAKQFVVPSNANMYSEYWESGKTFYQVMVSDRCLGYHESEHKDYVFNTMEEAEALIQYFKDSNTTMQSYKDKLLEETISYYNIDKKHLEDTFVKIGDTIGFTGYSLYERNRIEEEEEERLEEERNSRRTEGPYGGAFKDEEDYWRWKEGPGFFQ